MAKQIEAETLREWLDAQQPVTVLDIRTDEDRAQWAIPGSLHLNAYEALRAGQPGLLADAPFPLDRPVSRSGSSPRMVDSIRTRDARPRRPPVAREGTGRADGRGAPAASATAGEIPVHADRRR